MQYATHLHQRALLVTFRSHCWAAKKGDEEGGRAAARNAGAEEGMYEASKYLLATDPTQKGSKKLPEEYRAIRSAITAARQFYYSRTLPWDDPWRIMLAAAYEEFNREMEAKIRAVGDAVAAFVPVYPSLILQAARSLNGGFDPGQYPSPDTIGNEFWVKMNQRALPNTEDLRLDMSDQAFALVAEEIRADERHRIGDGMGNAWERLTEPLKHMIERMDAIWQPGAKLYDSVFTNLKDIVDALPGMNLTGDENMDRACKEIRDRLLIYKPEQVKEDEVTRSVVAIEAKNILEEITSKMDGFYAA